VPAARPSPAASGAQAAANAASETAENAGPSHDQQLAERAARIAAQRQKEAEEAARRRKEKGKAKAEQPEPEETDAAGKPRDQVKSAAQQLRQRQAEARRERERILKQIEYDRTERKRRDEARRAVRLEEAQMAEEGGEAAEPSAQPAGSFGSRSQKRHEFCALQVRLLDGSTIRTRLPSSDNIRSDVRKWVDESRGSDRTPYTLRVIFPSRLIDETEEDRSLEALGLTPSSTLVLVPVARFSSAYQNEGDGILGRIIAFIRHIIMMIVTFFTTIFTGAPREQQPEFGASTLQQPPARRQDATRLRGQNDAQRDYQLYNGNSVSLSSSRLIVSLSMVDVWLIVSSSTSNQDQKTMRPMRSSPTENPDASCLCRRVLSLEWICRQCNTTKPAMPFPIPVVDDVIFCLALMYW